MIDERAWQEFHDGLDALASGEGDADLRDRLTELAVGIPDGRLMLELAIGLAADRLDDLAARAPEDLVARTWDRLEAILPARTAPRRPAARWPGGRAWVGLAAAATIALIFLSGYLVGERRQLQARLDDVLAHDSRGPAADVRAGALPALATDRTWTTGELRLLLARLPSQAVLADEAELTRLLLTGPLLKRRPARRLIDRYAATDGLTVGEALRLLDELSPDPDAELDIEGLGLARPRRILSY
ncbi:hypothetical protein H8E07_17585 [bacterium]|nr:hypothetical protein [bacterium]